MAAEAIIIPQVLVTGASGFIATHIIQQLLTGGQVKVRGTVRSLKNEAKVKPLQDLVPDATYPLELVEADLLNEESWKEAVKGCTHVYHVASPFPPSVPTDENEVIRPAVEGTLNVLKACAESGMIKRVVLTSSIAAIGGGVTRDYNETDWANDASSPYHKSKMLAEKAAWDFVDKLEDDKKFELAVVNPGLVIGPVLSLASSDSTSQATVKKILENSIPALVNVNFALVDVRDVALAHIAAMEKQEAAGNRHIIVGNNMWMKEIAEVVSREFQPQGYKIKLWVMPKVGVWFAKFALPLVRLVYPVLGVVSTYSNAKMRNDLGVEPRDIESSILDTCYSLIESGAVPKTGAYRGPPTPATNLLKQEGEPSPTQKDDVPTIQQEEPPSTSIQQQESSQHGELPPIKQEDPETDQPSSPQQEMEVGHVKPQDGDKENNEINEETISMKENNQSNDTAQTSEAGTVEDKQT